MSSNSKMLKIQALITMGVSAYALAKEVQLWTKVPKLDKDYKQLNERLADLEDSFGELAETDRDFMKKVSDSDTEVRQRLAYLETMVDELQSQIEELKNHKCSCTTSGKE